MKINILIDKSSWANEYKSELLYNCRKVFKNTYIYNSANKIRHNSFITVFFSYFKKVNNFGLKKSKFNIVLHESDLPKGRGMSPITWHILKKKKNIVFSLIKVAEKIDAGDIYYQKKIQIKNNLIFNEIKFIQFNENLKLLLKFLKYVKSYNKEPKSYKQKGKPSYFKLRKPADSIIEINKSIKSQFDLLRTADYKNYPSFFFFRNRKYYLKLENEKLYYNNQKNLG